MSSNLLISLVSQLMPVPQGSPLTFLANTRPATISPTRNELRPWPMTPGERGLLRLSQMRSSQSLPRPSATRLSDTETMLPLHCNRSRPRAPVRRLRTPSIPRRKVRLLRMRLALLTTPLPARNRELTRFLRCQVVDLDSNNL